MCKVGFNGYDILIHETNTHLLDNTIDFSKIENSFGVVDRVAKYVHHKNFGLSVKEEDLKKVDNLYLFKESHGLSELLQLGKLLNNEFLQDVFKIISLISLVL